MYPCSCIKSAMGTRCDLRDVAHHVAVEAFLEIMALLPQPETV